MANEEHQTPEEIEYLSSGDAKMVEFRLVANSKVSTKSR